MYAAPGVGLAANQIGLSVRMFVYDPSDGAGPGVVCNPVLSGLEGEQDEDEGCLSIPGLYYATKRALRVRAGRNRPRWPAASRSRVKACSPGSSSTRPTI